MQVKELQQPAPLATGPARTYTISEVAKLLCVSYFTVRRLGESGALRVIRVSPRRIAVREADLEAFLATRPETARVA